MVDRIRASATRIGALALGTSLSAPVVSGAVALVDEAWRDLHSSSGADPNRAPPELVKALLINSAQELARSGPDYAYGHGLLRAQWAIDTLQRPNTTGQSSLAPTQVRTGFISEGEVLDFDLVTPVGPGTYAAKVTLAWMDVPGTSGSVVRYCNQNNKVECTLNAQCQFGLCYPAACGAQPCDLVNDLDLRVEEPGQTYAAYPFIGPGAANPTGNASNGVNHVDNVETVSFLALAQGTWHVKVTGFSIVNGPQRFALVSDFHPLVSYPPNDDFANAQLLPDLVAPVPISYGCIQGPPCPETLYEHNEVTSVNFDATIEPGEPQVAGSAHHRHSVWFRWVAPHSGPAGFDTGGADFDTVLGVYTGFNVSSLTPVATGDDAFGKVQSAVTLDATAGQTYYVSVAGWQGPTEDKSMGIVPLHYYLPEPSFPLQIASGLIGLVVLSRLRHRSDPQSHRTQRSSVRGASR